MNKLAKQATANQITKQVAKAKGDRFMKTDKYTAKDTLAKLSGLVLGFEPMDNVPQITRYDQKSVVGLSLSKSKGTKDNALIASYSS